MDYCFDRYAPGCMQARNRRLVEGSCRVIAYCTQARRHVADPVLRAGVGAAGAQPGLPAPGELSQRPPELSPGGLLRAGQSISTRSMTPLPSSRHSAESARVASSISG